MTKTSREASSLLDSCKVDIAFCPFNIQAKSGYAQRRPKADELFLEMNTLLKKNFPKGDPVHNKPPVLIHKISGRYDHTFLVTMQYKDWLDLVEIYAKNTDTRDFELSK